MREKTPAARAGTSDAQRDMGGGSLTVDEVLDGSAPAGGFPQYPLRLANLEHVRAEMRRVYADARQGRISSQEAARLVWMLSQLKAVVEAIRDGGYADRLLALEERLRLKQGGNAP
jgi:hypothetical protein